MIPISDPSILSCVEQPSLDWGLNMTVKEFMDSMSEEHRNEFVSFLCGPRNRRWTKPGITRASGSPQAKESVC
jgi:hypothetical protein